VSQYTELTTARLLLRALVPADTEALVRQAGDERVARTTLVIPHPYTTADATGFIALAARWWDRGDHATWGVTTGDALVGCMGLTFTPEHRRAELGYWIGPQHWGRGYATEAGAAVVAWAFAAGWERLTAGIFAGNRASERVVQKLGFQQEGLLRRHYLRFGDWKDVAFYARLRDDR
jgi:RimJ/RimL family protein N-acetyltransferase